MGDRLPPALKDTGTEWIAFLDRAWDFFASTKVAAVLIVLLAAASVAGSLVEQETLYQDWRPPHLYYPDRYGPFWGSLFMKLGLTHAYTSIWYAGLVLLLVISLIVCSLNRLVPLHRMLTRPQVYKLPHFLRRQQVVFETHMSLTEAHDRLRRRGYKIRQDRECLYADRGRISRYGPYIVHIGLLIVAFAAFAKGIPGWDQTRDVWIPDGQTVKVPDTNFAITNHKFTMDLYPSGAPSRFTTDAGVVVGGQEVHRQTIEVNHPLSFQGWDIYQASWREEPGIAHVEVVDAASQEVMANVAIDLRQPEPEFIVSARLKMVITSYYHDFRFDPVTRQPTNASFDVKNPVLMAEFVDRENGERLGRAALMVLAKDAPVVQGPYYLQTNRVETRWFTALKLHKDLTVPYMFGGLSVVMLGLFITFFFFHWQVWVREEDGRVLIGGRAHKNTFGLKRQLTRLFGIPEGEGEAL